MHSPRAKLREVLLTSALGACIWAGTGTLSAASGACPAAPWGEPTAGREVCRQGYALGFDSEWHEPRWVEYTLSGDHTFGCLDRSKFPFRADPLLAESAHPSDYTHSGYDLGHMAPAQDGAWDSSVMKDFFLLSNIAPQLPGLNRAEWERLEEAVRAWAWARGEVVVIVGPIVGGKAARIGTTGVAVPLGFYKVVVDPKTHEALAFMMPQKPEPKGDLEPWLTDIASIEQSIGFKLALPANVVETVLWPADIAGWHREHKARCK